MPSSPPNPNQDPGRRRPAHWAPKETGNQTTIIFVTVCTNDRKPILARADAVAALRNAWAQADTWVIGRFAIMPDHVHFFCAPQDPQISLKRWIKYWKAMASRRWPRPNEQPIWQEDFWDTQLRREESYAAKWEYVRNNPVRHGLVTRPEDWPWSGEIESLSWHER